MYQTPPPGYPAVPAPQASGPCGQNPSPNGAAEKRVLYVGNLAPDCTEQILAAVFAQFGDCLACKIIRGGNPGSDNYAFMELGSHQQALVALTAMNRISLMGRELRVNWATAPGVKPDPSKGHHVFLGDLITDIDEREIMEVFLPYGPIVECKIVRHQDGGCKTYAFLVYENEADATAAIEAQNGNLLRFRPMRVSWASRRNRPRSGGDGGGSGLQTGPSNAEVGPLRQQQQQQQQRRGHKRSYDEVYNETTLYNTSVYIGGIQSGLTESLVREHLNQFGAIQDVKLHTEKGFAFVRFDSHDAAARAIADLQGARVGGFAAKLGWGREGAGPTPAKGPRRIDEQPPQPQHQHQHQHQQQHQQNPPTAAYQRYCSDYTDWYSRYGAAYYGDQQQPQQQQQPDRSGS